MVPRLVLAPLFLLVLAGCGTAARLQRVDVLEDSRAPGELPALSADPAPEVRARAVRALGRLQQRGAVAPVKAGLADVHPLVRCEAARAAGVLGLSWDTRVASEVAGALTPALLAAERAEGEGPCRGVQLEALGRLGTKAALGRLVEVLRDTGMAGVASASASAPVR